MRTGLVSKSFSYALQSRTCIIQLKHFSEPGRWSKVGACFLIPGIIYSIPTPRTARDNPGDSQHNWVQAQNYHTHTTGWSSTMSGSRAYPSNPTVSYFNLGGAQGTRKLKLDQLHARQELFLLYYLSSPIYMS